MKNRVYLACGVLLVAAMGGLLWWSPWEPREPIYRGRPLRAWLKAYALCPVLISQGGAEALAFPGMNQAIGRRMIAQLNADEALRQAGTNALPTLLWMLRAEDSALKVKLVALAKRQCILRIEFTPAGTWNRAAQLGFSELGAKAQSAVPALIKAVNRSKSHNSLSGAILALGSVGPSAREAVPLLLRCSTNANKGVRGTAMWALGQIRTEPDRVVPMLINSLHDPDDDIRWGAALSLRAFGPDAKLAVPALIECHKASSDATTRALVYLALNSIDPDATAKAGVKMPSP